MSYLTAHCLGNKEGLIRGLWRDHKLDLEDGGEIFTSIT